MEYGVRAHFVISPAITDELNDKVRSDPKYKYRGMTRSTFIRSVLGCENIE